MKIRSGFVSNSSTSSYIIVGCKVKDPSKYVERDDDDDDELLPGSLDEVYDTNIVGVRLASIDSDSSDVGGSIALKELEVAVKKVKKVVGKDAKVCIYYGTEAC
jgi:hypothetical protein